jgi:hypothetical protein
MFFWKWYVPYVKGIEISKWAREHSFVNKEDILLMDIMLIDKELDFDLVTVIDLLEHLEYDKLDKVLQMIQKSGKKFIFSIPFIGDPNLELDKTHIIKESKDWWISKLSQYINIESTPNEWAYNNQLIIGVSK